MGSIQAGTLTNISRLHNSRSLTQASHLSRGGNIGDQFPHHLNGFVELAKQKTQQLVRRFPSGPDYLCRNSDLTRAARHVQFYRKPTEAEFCRQEMEMRLIKQSESEVLESNRVFDLPGGPVTICEREVHEFYRTEEASTTRLVISGAIDRTRTFIAKAREEFTELNSLLSELVPR